MPLDYEALRKKSIGFTGLYDRSEDDFFSRPMSRNQRIRLRAARSETRKSERSLRQALGDDMLQMELDGGRYDLDAFVKQPSSVMSGLYERSFQTMSTVTEPLFDLLQIGQFTTAGAALELVNGGNGREALLRASSEFINALPFLDEEDAKAITGVDPTRVSYRDILSASNFEPFENARHNEYATAAAGFVLDVVLDPTTYYGGAILKSVGGGLGKLTMPFIDKPGISHTRRFMGEKFIPKFGLEEFKRKHPQLVTKDVDGKEIHSVDKFLSGLETRAGEMALGRVEIKDLALQLKADLSPAETRFLGLYLDQPKHFESILDGLTLGNAEAKTHLIGKFNAFKKEYKKLADDEIKAGVLDENIIRANYSPGRHASSHVSQKAFKKFMNKLGIPEDRQSLEFSDLGADNIRLICEGSAIFAKTKKFNTLEQRVLASVPTELDPGVTFAIRGLEHTRAMSTKTFVDSVLTDPNIAVKVTNPHILAGIKKGGEGLSLPALMKEFDEKTGEALWKAGEELRGEMSAKGLGVWRPFTQEYGSVTSLTKLKVGREFVGENDEVYKIVKRITKGRNKDKMRVKRLSDGEEVLFEKTTQITPIQSAPAYVMPEEFIKELRIADNIIANRSDSRKFFDHVRGIQNVWKGWAVFSPGFHARNLYSNVFNNWLGGVRNPATYAKSLALMFNKGDSIVLKGSKLPKEYKGKEIVDLATEHNLVRTGFFTKDIPKEIEEELFEKIYKTKGDKKEFLEKLSSLEGKGLDKVLYAQGEQGITRRDVLRGAVETAPIKAEHGFLRTVFTQANPFLKWNRWLGSKVEDSSKLQHFIEKIQGGMSADEAANSAKRYLFDYGELTEFERDIMKSVLPFYTWMRKNIPLQIQEIMRNPGRYGRLTAKPIGAIESLSEDWSNIPTPDYYKEIHAVRMPHGVAESFQFVNEGFDNFYTRMTGNAKATETGLQPVYLNPNFPFQDLNNVNARDIISSMSPFIKLPVELFTGEGGRGYSFFRDRPIERYEGEPGELPFLGVGPRLGKKLEETVKTLFPPAGKLQRLVQKGSRGQLAGQLLTEFAGIKAMQLDIDGAKRAKIYERRKKIRNIRNRYRDLGLLP